MPVIPVVLGEAKHVGEGVTPTVKSSTSNHTHATSCALTIPTSPAVSDGDIGILVAVNQTFQVFTTPTGWTLLGTKYSVDLQTSALSAYSVYKRVMSHTDTTINLVVPTSTVIVGVLAIVAGGSDIGVGPAFSSETDAPAGSVVDFPAIIPGPQDLVLLCGGGKSYLSTSANSSKISSAPTGFTIVKAQNGQVTVNASPDVSAFICSGPASAFEDVTLTAPTPQQNVDGGCSLTISPVSRRPTDQLPLSLQGASCHGYGNSYMTYVSAGLSGGGGSNTRHFSEALYIERIGQQMGGPFDFDGLGGGIAADICGGVFGTISNYYSRGAGAASGFGGSPSLDPSFAIKRAITWLAKSNRSGLVVLDCVGDDALAEYQGGSPFPIRAGAMNATDAMIRCFRASSIVEDTDTGHSFSPAYSGTWSNPSDPVFSGGSAHTSVAHGDTVTITTTQTDIDLVLLAIDNTANATPGASFSVTVDGVAWASTGNVGGPGATAGTTSNQMLQSTSSNFAQSTYTQMCVPCYNMGSGTHVIVITNTSTGGQILGFDGYLIKSTTPPVVVLCAIEHLDEAGSGDAGINGFSDFYSGRTWSSTLTGGIGVGTPIYNNTMISAIPKLFSDGRVIMFDPLDNGDEDSAGAYTGIWNPQTMINNGDYVHPLETGSAFYAHGIMRTLREQIA